MPIIDPPLPFRSPWWHVEGHSQTILPAVFRRIPPVPYQRERIVTDDDDFLDLDWIRTGSDRLIVITHGLEGSSDSQYVRGMARLFGGEGWDVLAWNCRSCSGEMNRQFSMYHHGEITDLHRVIMHALHTGAYPKIVLCGFSMGANITMKYLGVHGDQAPGQIVGAAVFSAPCDLGEGADALDLPMNRVYKTRFLRKLVAKLEEKNRRFPGRLDMEKMKAVRRWRDFDEWFSAPMCGYSSAAAFYEDASPVNFIPGIRRPTLLISALNDPILTPKCFPTALARDHRYFTLELPQKGGHCGFSVKGSPHSWAEIRTLQWVKNL